MFNLQLMYFRHTTNVSFALVSYITINVSFKFVISQLMYFFSFHSPNVCNRGTKSHCCPGWTKRPGYSGLCVVRKYIWTF